VIRQVEDFFSKQPEVDQFITVLGFSFNGRGQNSALAFVRLKPWDERKGSEHSVQQVIARSFAGLSGIKDAIVFPVNPPAISELGTSSGFDFQLQDLAGLGHERLVEARRQLLDLAAKNPAVTQVRFQGLEDTAQLKIELDEDKATTLGVSLGDINTTLQATFGSAYINNFVHGNRVQRVIMQLDAPFRMAPEDINRVFVRNHVGTMVPLSAFTRTEWTVGAPVLQRYNGFPAMQIIGSAPPGGSTGEAMLAMEEMARQLPAGIGFEWTGQSYEERLSGAQAPMLYALSIVVVFLCLAALYESWSIPLAVILVVPLGIVGALLATTLRGLPNDVYFKVGLLVTVGLSTKNAILIIEFAESLMEQGRSLIEATLEAVQLRLRPILMTSMAFILGVMPLVVSSGAGSASQNAIGTGVVGGMISGTILAVFLVPVFFVVVRGFFKRPVTRRPAVAEPEPLAERPGALTHADR
jgi:hydrophobe/amphiphile efflux-1 (HAE1) family protein